MKNQKKEALKRVEEVMDVAMSDDNKTETVIIAVGDGGKRTKGMTMLNNVSTFKAVQIAITTIAEAELANFKREEGIEAILDLAGDRISDKLRGEMEEHDKELRGVIYKKLVKAVYKSL